MADAIDRTKGLVACGYPVRDLDRLQSFYLAAKKCGRHLVVDLKQAYLLKLFQESGIVGHDYPLFDDRLIKIYIPRGTWGLIDKDLSKFSERQLPMDYAEWQRTFLDCSNAIDYRDVKADQQNLVFYCSDFKMQDLIDIRPDEGSSYIRSLTEPFDTEMELKEEQVRNWLHHFGIISSEKDWHQVHVSGHGDGVQIKKVIDGSHARKLIPIHTEHDEYHKKWHGNVVTAEQNKSLVLN